MKNIFIISLIALAVYACSGESKKEEEEENEKEKNEKEFGGIKDMMEDSAAAAKDARGVGKFTQVDLPATLDAKQAALGSGVYDLKCASCHKLSAEKIVGPGWQGVTTRRTPEWIMNFVTNTEEMLDKDAEAQAMLEICMVRMPNQNLSDEDSRNVLEFMRKNDGVK